MKISVLVYSLISVALIFTLPVFAQGLREGLVSYWNFDDGAGDTVHDVVGNSDGTIDGTPKWVDGKIGGGLEFDGTTNFVDCGADESLNITETLTLAAWIKVDIFVNWAGIVTKGINNSPYAMQIWSDGALRFSPNWGDPAGGVGSGSFNTDSKIPRAQWAHIAITYDGTKAMFYINGIPDALEVDRAFTFGTNEESLIMGADFPGGDEYYDGVIDEVYIYDRALTQAEIQKLMAEGGGTGGEAVSPSGKLGVTWGMIKG